MDRVYCGLATRPIGDERYAAFDGSSVASFENLIKQYFNSLPIHLLTDRLASGKRTPAYRLLMSAKIEPLYVRGDAYPHHASVTWSISGPGCSESACGTICPGGHFSKGARSGAPPVVSVGRSKTNPRYTSHVMWPTRL
jgi:hypothetical protein